MIKSEVIIHKVWRSEVSSIAIFLILSVGCIILSNKFTFLTLHGHIFNLNGYKVYLALPILWLIPVSYLFSCIFKIYNVIYRVDNRGIESCSGRLSMKQTVNRVRYEDIRGIDIHQTIIERMLDVGAIEIGTAASAENEVFLQGIDAPYEIKDMLERERDARLRNHQSD